MNEPELIDEILRTTKTIAVVGISDKPNRASYGVSTQMQRRGYRILPVNPRLKEVLGETCYPTLQDIPIPVDLVNVFRAPEFIPEVVEGAIAIGTPYLWLQEGVVHLEAIARAEVSGIRVVADLCLYKEHMHWQTEKVAH